MAELQIDGEVVDEQTQQLSRQAETGQSPFTPTRNTSQGVGEVYG